MSGEGQEVPQPQPSAEDAILSRLDVLSVPNSSPLPKHIADPKGQIEMIRRIFGRRPGAEPINSLADYHRDKKQTPLEDHDQIEVTVVNTNPISKSTVEGKTKKTGKGSGQPKPLPLRMGDIYHTIAKTAFIGTSEQDKQAIEDLKKDSFMIELMKEDPDTASAIFEQAAALQDFVRDKLTQPSGRFNIREVETTYRISLQHQKELADNPLLSDRALRAPNYQFIIDKNPYAAYAYKASARSDLVEFDCDESNEEAKQVLRSLQEIFNREKIFFNTRPLHDVHRYTPAEMETMKNLMSLLTQNEIHMSLYEIKSRLTKKENNPLDPETASSLDYRDVAYTTNAFYQWLTLFKPENISVQELHDCIRRNLDLNLIAMTVEMYNATENKLEPPEQYHIHRIPLDHNQIDHYRKGIPKEVQTANAYNKTA